MNNKSRFQCPACGFQIYNRRVAKCESCGGILPAELLLGEKQVADLDAQYEQSKKLREERLKRARHKPTTWGGEGFFDGDDGGGGDGGGD